MNIILGASGQVGSAIANNLIEKNKPVKGVIRNPEKTGLLESKGIEVRIADYFDLAALMDVVKDGELIFVLTPENGKSEDVLGDTQLLLNNYKEAITSSGINKIIGLSSIGAQHESGTGNLLMSNMLEKAFTDLEILQVFVRPGYYYSNWLMYLPVVEEQGILPTFFPVDQKIAMISPTDVAAFIAEKIAGGIEKSTVFELIGPEKLSSNDVANAFGKILNREVTAQQIPKEQWEEMLLDAGFTEDAAKNLIEMTEAVIDGRAIPEAKGTNPVTLKTTLEQYFSEQMEY